MVKGRRAVRTSYKSRVHFSVAALVLAALTATASPAQSSGGKNASGSAPPKERFLVSKPPDKPSLPPACTIPVDPLGFSTPGDFYLGTRNSLASLDFLDENHLLFTFRVPGLLHRDFANGAQSDERQIRAVVLTLPQGTVEAQATWTVHDRLPYLWMLQGGRFLLRDRNTIFQGDSTLTVKPLLDFPGSLLRLEFDPAQRYLVTNSREPASTPKPAEPGTSALTDQSGQVTSPSTASASVTSDEESEETASAPPDLVVRILRRDTGQVMLVSRVRTTIHLPINSQGYLENLRGRGDDWLLNLSYFTGGSRMLGRVDSACLPNDDFLSEDEVLISTCVSTGETRLVAMTTAGRSLWMTRAPATQVWPKLVVAANGSRVAWETLNLDHAVSAYAPIATEDVKAQSVTVFDAATGDIALVSPLTPMLDAGGNVAISPSGRRVALLNAGAVQVFDLPAPPPLPTDSAVQR